MSQRIHEDYDLTILDDGQCIVTCDGITKRMRNKLAAMRWVTKQRQRVTIRGHTAPLHAIRTCTEIGKILGLSKTRVEQIERAAMVKIKRELRDLEREWFDNG